MCLGLLRGVVSLPGQDINILLFKNRLYNGDKSWGQASNVIRVKVVYIFANSSEKSNFNFQNSTHNVCESTVMYPMHYLGFQSLQ